MSTTTEFLPEVEKGTALPAEEVRPQNQLWNLILDGILPLVTIAVLLLSCILGSPKKEIWIDEAYTLQVVTDASLPHMLHALAHAVDGGMPVYYVLAHGWGKIFGETLFSFRLLSSLFMCAGVLLLWITLRQAYSGWAVSLATACSTVTSAYLLRQNVEARYYGYYFACVVLVLALHLRLSLHPASRRLLAGGIVAHVALVMSHPFGVLYSGLAICALIFSDYRRGRLRWSVYAGLACSWLVLLAWMGPILKIHDLAVPRNWTPIPTFTEVLDLFAFASPCLAFGLLMGTGMSALAPKSKPEPGPAAGSDTLVYHAFAFLLLPIPIAVISWGNSSLFVDRYFLPSVVGVATLVACLLNSRLSGVRLTTGLRFAWLALLAVILSWPLLSVEKMPDVRVATLERELPSGLPIVVDDAHSFLPLTYISRRSPKPYYYPLDWEVALHSNDTVSYKLARNASAAGYLPGHVLEGREMMCRWDTFLVLDNPRLGWFSQRIFSSPDFQIEHVNEFSPDRQLWLVKRLPNASVCATP